MNSLNSGFTHRHTHLLTKENNNMVMTPLHNQNHKDAVYKFKYSYIFRVVKLLTYMKKNLCTNVVYCKCSQKLYPQPLFHLKTKRNFQFNEAKSTTNVQLLIGCISCSQYRMIFHVIALDLCAAKCCSPFDTCLL